MRDGSVGSVSCWFHCFLCKLPESDYLYHRHGWIFWGNSVTRAMISLRRIREILDTEPAMTFNDVEDEELEGSLSLKCYLPIQ